MQLAVRRARGMDRGQVDPERFEHFQQGAQRTGPVFGQVHAEAGAGRQVGEQVAQALEAVAAGREPIGIEYRLRPFEERSPHVVARGITAIGHAVAQTRHRCSQLAQHRQHMRIAELDVLVDRRISGEDASGHRHVQLEADGAQGMQQWHAARIIGERPQHACLGHVRGVHQPLHQRHRTVVGQRIDDDALGFECLQQRIHPRLPAREPGRAGREHAAAQGRSLRRRRHRMQAEHFGARMQHRLDRRLLDRGEVQPQLAGFEAVGSRDILADDRRRGADWRAEHQHVRACDQCLRRQRGIAMRIAADHLQPHAFAEEGRQPAAVGAGAADDADHRRATVRAEHGRHSGS